MIFWWHCSSGAMFACQAVPRQEILLLQHTVHDGIMRRNSCLQKLQERQSTARQPRRQNGDAGTDGNRADGSPERSPSPQMSDSARLERVLKKMSEADKVAKACVAPEIDQNSTTLFSLWVLEVSLMLSITFLARPCSLWEPHQVLRVYDDPLNVYAIYAWHIWDMQAAQEAKIKQQAQNLFLEEPGKLTDKLRLRKTLQIGLPLIVGYEQSLALKTAGEV